MNRVTQFVVKTRTVTETLTNWALFLGMGWVVIMMLLTTVDVASRTLFSKSVPGSIEMGEYMLAIFGILGMAYTHFAGANVKVTMLTQILPEKLQNFIEVLTCLMSLVIMATLTWYGGISGIEDMHAGTTTDNLGLPTFPIYWLLSVGAGLLSLVILVRLMTHVLGVFGIEVPKKAA